jgi:uncharacterized protein YneF (UPF0154 family)
MNGSLKKILIGLGIAVGVGSVAGVCLFGKNCLIKAIAKETGINAEEIKMLEKAGKTGSIDRIQEAYLKIAENHPGLNPDQLFSIFK